jgi:hypothetical protein
MFIEANEKGEYNFSDLVAEAENPASPKAEKVKEGEPRLLESVLAGLFISKVQFSNGFFSYYDEALPSLKNGIIIKSIDFSAEKINLKEATPFFLSCGLDSNAKDIQLTGTFGPLGENLNINNSSLRAKMIIPKFKLQQILTFIKDPSFTINSGVLKFESDISGDIESGFRIIGNGSLNSLRVSDPVSNERFIESANARFDEDILFNPQDINIVANKFVVIVNGITADVKGSINMGSEPPEYKVNLNTNKFDISSLQNIFSTGPQLLEGQGSGRLFISGVGFDFEQLQKNLKGEGNFNVEKGFVNNVNIEKEILSSIGKKYNMPVTRVAEMAGLEILKSERTSFDKFYGSFKIAGGKILIQNSTLTSKDRGFSMNGNVGFDQSLDINARMILKKTKDSKKKKVSYYLIDEEQRKYIPFSITGDSSKPNVKIDLEELTKGQVRQALDTEKNKLKEKLGPAGEELLKPLEKIFQF